MGYHKGHRPSSIREPPVESATSITVQQFRGPVCVVPIDGADPTVTFDGKPTPVGLQDLVGSQCLEDYFTPLVLVGLHEYPVSNMEGFAVSLYALVEGSFVPGLCLFHGIPY